MTLQKPPVTKSPEDWTLGAGWSVAYNNGVPTLVKAAGAGTADFTLPFPGKYRLRMIGTATALTVNGASVSLATPAVVEVDAGLSSTLSLSATAATLNTVIIEHWDNEFYIEGVTGASVIFDAQDIRTPNKRSAARSRNITVPATPNNIRALGELFEINHEGDFDPRKRAACTLSVDSITALDGYAQVISVNRGGVTWDEIVSFEIQVFDQLADFFSALGTKKISDLRFTEYTHNLGVTDITQAGWRDDPAEHLVKKNGSYVANYTHTLLDSSATVGLEELDYGAGPVKYFKFTTSVPISITVGDFVWVKKNTYGAGDQRKHTGEHRVLEIISPTEFVVSTTSNGGGGGSIQGTSVSLWLRSALGFGYVYVPADLGLDADITIGGSYASFYNAPAGYPPQLAGEQTYQVTASRMRPSVFLKEVIQKAAKSVGFEIVSNFFSTSEDFARIAVLPWHKEGISRDNYSRYLEDGVTTRPEYEVYNTTIDPTEFLPQEKLSDLIGDVIKMFNLYVHVVDRKIYLEPRDFFFSEGNVDWNSKIDQSSISVKLLPEHTAKTYEYTPAKANDSMAAVVAQQQQQRKNEFGAVSIETVNEFNTATVSNKLAVVEPTVIVAHAQVFSGIARKNFYTASSKAGDGQPLRKGVRLVYVSCKGIAGHLGTSQNRPFKIWRNWPGEDPVIPSTVADELRYIFPAGTHVDSVGYPMFDLNFLTDETGYPATWGGNATAVGWSLGKVYTDFYGLYGRYHQRSVRTATSARSRLLSGTGTFTHKDVTTLDLRRLISYDGQLWQLNKIEFDLATMAGKFELLLVQDLGSTKLAKAVKPAFSKPDIIGEILSNPVALDPDVLDPITGGVVIGSVSPLSDIIIKKPLRPLQRFTIMSGALSFRLEGEAGTLIDGLTNRAYTGGTVELWSPDGVNWTTVSETPSGASGFSGFSGVGTSGFSGFSGYSGKGESGFSGFSGFSGIGTSGFSGFSGAGTSGFSGAQGVSGFSGFSGVGGLSAPIKMNSTITHTGTATETKIWSAMLPANTLQVGDLFEFMSFVGVNSNANNKTFRLYVNTSDTLSGAVQLGVLTHSTVGVNSIFQRFLQVVSSTQWRVNPATAAITSSYGNNAGAWTTATADITQDLWLMVSCALNNASDTMLLYFVTTRIVR
jgi:hypothetical protein